METTTNNTIQKLQQDFPLLSKKVNSKSLVY